MEQSSTLAPVVASTMAAKVTTSFNCFRVGFDSLANWHVAVTTACASWKRGKDYGYGAEIRSLDLTVVFRDLRVSWLCSDSDAKSQLPRCSAGLPFFPGDSLRLLWSSM